MLQVSATVHRARCASLNEIVAIKRFQLDRLDLDLQVSRVVRDQRRMGCAAVLARVFGGIAEGQGKLELPS